MKPKLCYVLPKYDLNTGEHFYHNYQFLEELGKEVELCLIIERCIGEPEIKHIQRLYKQKFTRYLPLRVLEMTFFILFLRTKGIKRFYVHYSYFGGLIGSLLCKLTGGKVYYWHCVSVVYKTKWTLSAKELLPKIKAEIPLKLTLKLTDYLVTGTKSLGAFYYKTFGVSKKKMIFLPNEIDLARFNPGCYPRKQMRERLGIREDERIVLYVHRVVERKGAHHITEIAQKVGNAVSNVTFIIAGDGPYFEALRKEIENTGLGSRVRLLGSVPNRKIMELYAAADVFMMPSEEEGFPRVLLETMAMGIPFVATDVGGVKEICTDLQKRFIVPAGDSPLFSSRVVELLNSESFQNQLKKEGLEKVKEFSIPVVRKHFLEKILHGQKD